MNKNQFIAIPIGKSKAEFKVQLLDQEFINPRYSGHTLYNDEGEIIRLPGFYIN